MMVLGWLIEKFKEFLEERRDGLGLAEGELELVWGIGRFWKWCL